MICPEHPEITLPHMLTCPLCAQAQRRQAYLAQLAQVARQMADAAQPLPRPATEASEDTP